MRSVDANIFLRFFAGDDEAKTEACLELFQRVRRGEEVVTTSEAIVAEVVYVLSSPRLYNLSHADIAAHLAPILTLRGLRMENKRVVQRALQLYARHQFLDFEDALAVAHMERHRIGEIYSYDRDFDRLPEFRATPGLRRLEPSR